MHDIFFQIFSNSIRNLSVISEEIFIDPFTRFFSLKKNIIYLDREIIYMECLQCRKYIIFSEIKERFQWCLSKKNSVRILYDISDDTFMKSFFSFFYCIIFYFGSQCHEMWNILQKYIIQPLISSIIIMSDKSENFFWVKNFS